MRYICLRNKSGEEVLYVRIRDIIFVQKLDFEIFFHLENGSKLNIKMETTYDAFAAMAAIRRKIEHKGILSKIYDKVISLCRSIFP